jgi:hypothetical protein
LANVLPVHSRQVDGWLPGVYRPMSHREQLACAEMDVNRPAGQLEHDGCPAGANSPASHRMHASLRDSGWAKPGRHCAHTCVPSLAANRPGVQSEQEPPSRGLSRPMGHATHRLPAFSCPLLHLRHCTDTAPVVAFTTSTATSPESGHRTHAADAGSMAVSQKEQMVAAVPLVVVEGGQAWQSARPVRSLNVRRGHGKQAASPVLPDAFVLGWYRPTGQGKHWVRTGSELLSHRPRGHAVHTDDVGSGMKPTGHVAHSGRPAVALATCPTAHAAQVDAPAALLVPPGHG